MAKSKKQLTPAQKASNAIRKPQITAKNKQRRAAKHLKKHPNDKVAQIVLVEGKGPEQHHKPKVVPDAILRARKQHDFKLQHPDDPKAGDYFRTPHHLNWKAEVRRDVAEVMASQFEGRENSDPFAYDRFYARIFGGLGHLEDYTFKPGSMVRHA